MKIVRSPAVPECDRDRNGLRVVVGGQSFRRTNQLEKRFVRVQFFEQHTQETNIPSRGRRVDDEAA